MTTFVIIISDIRYISVTTIIIEKFNKKYK